MIFSGVLGKVSTDKLREFAIETFFLGGIFEPKPLIKDSFSPKTPSVSLCFLKNER